MVHAVSLVRIFGSRYARPKWDNSFLVLVTGKDRHDSAQCWREVEEGKKIPHVQTFKFKGRGQRLTPVAPVRDLIRVIFDGPSCTKVH